MEHTVISLWQMSVMQDAAAASKSSRAMCGQKADNAYV